jgi:tRNA-Thr(GGU) m(6)t(6)A37 methyltransferase TsaA
MTENSQKDGDDEFVVRPVGHVESKLREIDDAPNQGNLGAPNAWLVLRPEIAEAARDLKPGDRIVLLTWLHKARRDVLSAYPGSRADLPHLGVFSLRSPNRPNSIGLHPVEILERDGLRIRVNNLEAIDGTPILDIKPEI